MNNTKRTKSLQIIAAAALSLTVLGAGATYARAMDAKGAQALADADVIYSDVGTSYGSYDFSGSAKDDLPIWEGEIG